MTFLRRNRLRPRQEDGLRQIFVLTMEVLQEFGRRENLNAQMSSVFQRYLALANQVLSWNFLPPNYILSRVRVTQLAHFSIQSSDLEETGTPQNPPPTTPPSPPPLTPNIPGSSCVQVRIGEKLIFWHLVFVVVLVVVVVV